MSNFENSKPKLSTTDKLPPHSKEAEQGVIGCILLDPQQSLPVCIEKIKDGASAFYDLKHQVIYETLCELFDDGDPIDLITLQERLKLWKKLDQVGGLSYLIEIQDCVPSAVNLPYYLDILRGKASLRKMVRVCTEVVTQIQEYSGQDVDEIMDSVETQVLKVSESRVLPTSLHIGSLVQQALGDFERAIAHQGQPQGITSGFIDLDKMTDGFHGGEFVVIAARPSMGKTSLALNITEHIACDLQLPVGIISLEMKGVELVKRMICSRARVNIRNGYGAEDHPKIISAASNVMHTHTHIDDTGGMSIMQIRAKARRWWQQHGIKILIIDYLQLSNAIGNRAESRQQEVSMISLGCKNLAKELDIPVIGLCQLNRDIEKDKHRKPRLSDLRESGSLEQDSDVVGMLYKPKNGDEDEDGYGYAEPINLLIAKNRNGPTGDVNLTFIRPFTRFESAAKP